MAPLEEAAVFTESPSHDLLALDEALEELSFLDPRMAQVVELRFFGGLAVTLTHSSDQAPLTTLTIPVADQAALRGLLCKLWDLNLTLISVRRIEAKGKKGTRK